MRLVIDSLVAVMLAAILAGAVLYTRSADDRIEQIQTVSDDVRDFQRQIMLQSALADVERSGRGYPLTVDPQWFDNVLPKNTLLSDAHPWLEIAGPDQKELLHPPDRIAADSRTARFWYNPGTGRVRARVPAGISDAHALELYNSINRSQLPSLFSDGGPTYASVDVMEDSIFP